jgi:DNA-binding NarL/FixJ family response regulator
VSAHEDTSSVPKSRVFLVDDHPLVREWLTSLINQQRDLIVCGEADDPPEALRRIAAARADVAVVDISLKAGSGLELIKQMKASHPNVAVVVLSMHEESLYGERALRAGASGYVVKRDTPKKVVAAIRRVLDGQLYLSERFAALMAERFVKGRQPVSESPVEELSDRELEIFDLLGQGIGTRQIAEKLCVSIKTVQAYCARIKEKLHLQNATELLREAIRWQYEKDSH